MKQKNFFTRFIALSVLLIAFTTPAFAKSRVSLGASWTSIGMQGAIGGEKAGGLYTNSMGPNIVLEAEFIPIEQWSIFMRGELNPFMPKIKSSRGVLPLDPDTLDTFTITESFALGTGWQLPFTTWINYFFPLELTLGLGSTLNMFNQSYSTPNINSNITELSFGAGFFLALSWYPTEVFGLTISSMPSVTAIDWTISSVTATGGNESKHVATTFTALRPSWDVSLLFSFRFGD